MAIFSRRTLQRVINENAKFVKKKEAKKHIDALNVNEEHQKLIEEGKKINEPIRTYLDNEWEVVVLNSLSKSGDVKHEEKIGGSKPDVFYTSKKYAFKFLGDITCITGTQDRDNVPLTFKNEFKEIIDRENLGGYWSIFINGNTREMDFCKVKPDLKLKTKEQRGKILTSEEFAAFIEKIKKNPEKKHSFTFKENKKNPEPLPKNQIELFRNVDIDVRIQYEPRSFYQVEVSQFDDRKIVNLENDEIYKSCFRKYEQLVKTNYPGCLGIFLCDGIGDTFNRGDLLYSNSKQVIYKFLGDHKIIDFILTVTSESEPYNFNQKAKIKLTLYQNCENKLTPEIIRFLENDLVKDFPKPARTVIDARNALKFSFTDKKIMISSGGCGLSISYNQVEISSRTMLEILSGKLSLEKVLDYWRFETNGDNSAHNEFLRMLNEGKLFSEAKIEKGDNEIDDDWLVFKFGEPDAAVSPFKIPDSYK